jgi:hypothetical protein
MAGSADAITFLDIQYGTPRPVALPRSLAMGGTGVAWMQGSQAVVNNPAALALYDKRFGVDVGLGFWHAGENRSVPLYDSFESYVRENIFALNRNTYGDIQGGLLWRVYDEIPMTVAFGVYDRFDFDYNYFEEIRDPSGFSPDPRDQIFRTHEWNVDGRIRSASVGYGSQVWGPTHMGVAVHRYFGSTTNTRRVVAIRTPSDGVQEQSVAQDFEGWGYSVGAHGSPNAHLDLAVNWEGEFLVRGTRTVDSLDTSVSNPQDVTGSSEEWVRYPGTLTFGATYRPRNILRTTFSVEAVRRFWENLEDSTIDGAAPVHLRDTWDLRLGLEHIFYNQMPLRFGFRFVENYADPTSDRSIYSAGIGYTIAEWQVDVTGQYGRQTSRQEFLFDRSVTSQGDVFNPPDGDTRVDDSVVSLVVGVSRGF